MTCAADLARFYAAAIAAGFEAFPLDGGSNRPWLAGDSTPWPRRPALTATEAIRATAAGGNIGVRTTPERPDLLILDADGPGQAARIAALVGDADPLTALTPRGRHYYFAGGLPASGVSLRGPDRPCDLARGGGSRGYVVGPGAHRTADDYRRQRKAPPDTGGGPWAYRPGGGRIGPLPATLAAAIAR